MSNKMIPRGHELFNQPLRNYDLALHTGLKAQEDAINGLWECVSQAPAPHDRQRHSRATNYRQLAFLAQRRIEESLQLVEQNGLSSLTALKRSFKHASIKDRSVTQTKMQELEASLQALLANAQAVTQMSGKVVEFWVQRVQKEIETPPAAKAA